MAFSKSLTVVASFSFLVFASLHVDGVDGWRRLLGDGPTRCQQHTHDGEDAQTHSRSSTPKKKKT